MLQMKQIQDAPLYVPVFCYQQGGVRGEGIYPTFAAALAAATAVSPLNPTITIDGSKGQPVIPPGSYAIPSNLHIAAAQGFPQLNIQDGAHFTFASAANVLILDGVTMNNQSTTAPFSSISSGNFEVICLNGATLESDTVVPASQPFFSFTGSAIGFVEAIGDAGVIGAAGAPIFSTTTPASMALSLGQLSYIVSDSFAGNGETTVYVLDNSVEYSQTQTATNLEWSVWGAGTIQTRVQANNTSAQSIADGGGAVTVTNWTAQVNASAAASGSSLNTTTGVFTVPLQGFYDITAQVEFAAIAATLGAEFTIGIYQNGALVQQGVVVNAVAAGSIKRSPQVAFCVNCAVGDLLTIRVSQNSGSGAVLLTNVAARNFLAITYAN